MKRTGGECRKLAKQIRTSNIEIAVATKSKPDVSMARKITVLNDLVIRQKEKPLRDGSPESGKQN